MLSKLDEKKSLPAGWRWVKLGEVTKAQSGGTPWRGNPAYYGGPYPWAKIEDLTRAGMWIDKTEETITDLGLSESSARVFPAGTVLFAMYGSIGTASIARLPITTNQAILGCECSETLLPEFLWFWFALMKNDLLSQGRGGTQANLNAGIVKNLDFPLPSITEQKRMVKILTARLSAVERARVAAEAQLDVINMLPAALLKQAFNGGL